MKTLSTKRQPAGFVSYLLVLTTATLLSLLSIYAYRRAMTAHKIESQVQLKIDYSEKEEAILRSIVAIVPNRAMRAMGPNSAVAATAAPLSWNNIFNESLVMANSRTSIPAALETQMGLAAAGVRKSNTTDSTGTLLAQNVFREILPLNPVLPGLVSAGSGNGQALGASYPPLLNFKAGAVGDTDAANDRLYPIVSNTKQYGALAAGRVGLLPEVTPGVSGRTPGTDYQKFNLVPYPQINFGYGTPGQNFITKRNWWAFSLDTGAQDAASTNLARVSRDFVLSIYEIPSQLPISSAAYTAIGTNQDLAGGGDWQTGRVNVDGNVFTGRASLVAPGIAAGTTAISGLASRGGATIAAGVVLGGEAMSGAAGVAGDRETYLNNTSRVGLANNATLGAFYPLSRASDSGRLAFIPISAGAQFYDRFMQPDFASDKYRPNLAANALSSTAWNDYTIGARQCAMQLDITSVKSTAAVVDITTSITTFSYLVNGVRNYVTTTDGLVPDKSKYIRIRGPGEVFDVGATPVKVAFGSRGVNFGYRTLAGSVVFNEATFGPLLNDGYPRAGYIVSPFEPAIGDVPVPAGGGVQTVTVYPQRFPLVLAALGADSTSFNNSLVVNVNYASGVGVGVPATPANAGAIAGRYTLVLKECANLTSFPTGFSLVTNMNLNIPELFNTVPFPAANLPPGYAPAVTASNALGQYFTPCSIFAPSCKYGTVGELLPGVVFGGQRNSLKADNGLDVAANRVNPLKAVDLNMVAAGQAQMPAANLTHNLRKIIHPVELPPVNMMNWMVLLEEKRREF
jgi:hypothetical protein